MVMSSRWARVARGSATAMVATLTAAVSHTLAGGVPPTAFGLVASLVISCMLSTVLTARHLSIVRLALAIGASQVLFHALFSGLGTPTVVDHVHGGARVDALVATHDHEAMTLAHLAAGVVTLLVFRYAEVAFWALAGWARLVLTRVTRPGIPVVTVRAPRVVATTVLLAPLGTVLLSSMRRRGPPGAFAVA